MINVTVAVMTDNGDIIVQDGTLPTMPLRPGRTSLKEATELITKITGIGPSWFLLRQVGFIDSATDEHVVLYSTILHAKVDLTPVMTIPCSKTPGGRSSGAGSNHWVQISDLNITDQSLVLLAVNYR